MLIGVSYAQSNRCLVIIKEPKTRETQLNRNAGKHINNSAKIKIYNNTEDNLTAVSIFADCNEKRLNNTIINGLQVLARQVETVVYNGDYSNLKHFLWRDLKSMIPIN